MKIRIKKGNVLVVLSYITFLMVYLISLMIYGMGNDNSRVRYYFLAAAIVIAYIAMLSKYGLYFFRKDLHGKELNLVLIIGVIFWIISVQRASEIGKVIPFRTYVQIALILFPALYAFSLINLFSIHSLINIMKASLICLVIIYFLEPDHTIFQFFVRSNWINLTFLNSFTESSLCAESFLQLFLFFNFYRNVEKQDKSMQVCFWISLIFTILSFKRLGIVFALLMLVLNYVIDLRGRISTKWVWFFSVFFSVMTHFYFKFMIGELLPNVNVYEFSTGRDYILSLWENAGYESYGYGSSMLVIGRYLEMDLIQIMLELNGLALFVFCYVFFRIGQKNVYSMLIMSYIFLNMLTASSIPYSLGWIIAMLTVSTISSEKYKAEGLKYEMKHQKFKRLISNNRDS